jgi:hypothetical protein
MLASTLRGAAAGAAATTALNAATYLDMAVRGRGASSTPEQSVEGLLDRAGVDLPGNEDARANRVSALGSLLGLVTGTAVGAAYGAATSLVGRPGPVSATALGSVAAMLAGNGPMVLLGITDPRSWSAGDWLSDLLPHAAYGAVLAAAFEAATGDR